MGDRVVSIQGLLVVRKYLSRSRVSLYVVGSCDYIVSFNSVLAVLGRLLHTLALGSRKSSLGRGHELRWLIAEAPLSCTLVMLLLILNQGLCHLPLNLTIKVNEIM